MAPHLRPRTSQVKPQNYATGAQSHDRSSRHSSVAPLAASIESDDSAPPVYTIDLSLAPSRRYLQVIIDYESSLRQLPRLLDDIIDELRVPNRIVHVIARLLLRKVHDREQNEELKGISSTLGLPIYLLVAYNVLLDLFMGCTSGGARVQPSDTEEPRMMHFRTLDWGMPALRDIVVQYEFVEAPGAQVIARTISYVGYVGVLTGLRKELSVSINFRPYHNDDTSLAANMRFYLHQLSVLLGLKPSISSILRDFVLPRNVSRKSSRIENARPSRDVAKPLYGHGDICTTLPSIPTTAAYLIFCTPHETVILEKDRKTAKILKSSTFIATTNHDASYDTNKDTDHTEVAHLMHAKQHSLGMGMEDIIDESMERKRCLVEKWMTWSAEEDKKGKRRRKHNRSDERDTGVPIDLLKEWLHAYPTTNQETHFSCLMDPARGEFRWVKRYEEGEVMPDSDSMESSDEVDGAHREE
ncbi:beta subunit of N-acylethanolamine-hydrolyzing acid amidase-domain-containing protein [Paraphoma chrysanthemicola]|uniref:ceramidase n=1 Tax=Paraphoma chrysanthemicola TaxID=798071 RepID=A0A8K0QRI5_9PLEO|nr:beta subunit of N-acylethanolamine-hydrolyzing acid amidase-domain-containing protein [Paraphoma chrysanthemicola]